MGERVDPTIAVLKGEVRDGEPQTIPLGPGLAREGSLDLCRSCRVALGDEDEGVPVGDVILGVTAGDAAWPLSPSALTRNPAAATAAITTRATAAPISSVRAPIKRSSRAMISGTTSLGGRPSIVGVGADGSARASTSANGSFHRASSSASARSRWSPISREPETIASTRSLHSRTNGETSACWTAAATKDPVVGSERPARKDWSLTASFSTRTRRARRRERIRVASSLTVGLPGYPDRAPARAARPPASPRGERSKRPRLKLTVLR